jgi:cytochrome c-type biogenesis protein CcmH/NrfG
MRWSAEVVFVACCLVLAARSALGAGPSAAAQALALCQLAEQQTAEARDDFLTRGLALAESAVRADPGDGRAHFAVFCNLGRRVQAAGLSVFHLLEIVRALDELEAAVRLAPDDPDVAAAKGAVLANLPPLLGGDATAGEQWLRRALALDPHHREARAYLAAALSRRGAEDEARRVRDPD